MANIPPRLTGDLLAEAQREKVNADVYFGPALVSKYSFHLPEGVPEEVAMVVEAERVPTNPVRNWWLLGTFPVELGEGDQPPLCWDAKFLDSDQLAGGVEFLLGMSPWVRRSRCVHWDFDGVELQGAQAPDSGSDPRHVETFDPPCGIPGRGRRYQGDVPFVQPAVRDGGGCERVHPSVDLEV
jgi:hypothetical protein